MLINELIVQKVSYDSQQCVWLVSTQRLAEARGLSSWSQMRQSTRRLLRRLREDGQEWLSSLKLWRGDIHLIEGEGWKLRDIYWFLFRICTTWANRWKVYRSLFLSSPSHFPGMFGTGILSYFSFLRFLVMLNFIIFLLMFSFVMLPIIIAHHTSGNITYNPHDGERTLVWFHPVSIKRSGS